MIVDGLWVSYKWLTDHFEMCLCVGRIHAVLVHTTIPLISYRFFYHGAIIDIITPYLFGSSELPSLTTSFPKHASSTEKFS